MLYQDQMWTEKTYACQFRRFAWAGGLVAVRVGVEWRWDRDMADPLAMVVAICSCDFFWEGAFIWLLEGGLSLKGFRLQMHAVEWYSQNILALEHADRASNKGWRWMHQLCRCWFTIQTFHITINRWWGRPGIWILRSAIPSCWEIQVKGGDNAHGILILTWAMCSRT